jgi:hypothetical protein
MKQDEANIDLRAACDAGEKPASISRRGFVKRLVGASALSAGAGAMGVGSLVSFAPNEAQADEVGLLVGEQRRREALRLRMRRAISQYRRPLPPHVTNGDEERYPTLIGNFGKTLPHLSNGEVDPNAYAALVRAVTSGRAADYEAIPSVGKIKLVDPRAAHAFQLEGADSHRFAIAPAPAFASETLAGEMAELYWQALLRDVPFSQYGAAPLAQAAVRDLARFPQFRSGSAQSLFRAPTPGSQTGPYVSQFLWLDVPYGSTKIRQRYATPIAGQDRMTAFDEWLQIQLGHPAAIATAMHSTPRYIHNGRALAEWVRKRISAIKASSTRR